MATDRSAELHIVIYTEGLPFDGDAPFQRSLGGSESAVVFMARELARRGHTVRVFCRCQRPGEYEAVSYHDLADFPEFVEASECDVFICCRHLRALTAPVRSKVNVVWNHDLLQQAGAQYLMSLMYKVDRLFVLSEFHKQQFMRHLSLPEDRYLVTRNGVDLELVDQAIAGVPRHRNRLLYTSRPERGLEVMLELWPELKRRRPELRLAIAWYENPGADQQMADYLAALRRAASELPDVEQLGALSKRDLYREIAGSGLVVYPAVFPEVSCISALEAAACGTPMVASRYCALKESVADGETGVLIPGDPRGEEYREAFVRAVVGLLSDDAAYRAMSAAARRRVEARYQWREIAAEWEEAFAPGRRTGASSCPRDGRPRAGGRQTVSVCMIVRNAQGTLYRCLESVKPIADEIIVCDTGSTDHTLEIARQFTDQVHQDPWEDDFAAARNRSIQRAAKDWILWIDADEYLVGAEQLGKYLRDNMYNGYVIRQHHQAIDAQFKPDVPVRLFRNRRGIRFFGCVHEHPEFALNQGVTPAVILSDVHIVHDGYVTEAVRRRRFLRNLPLLLKDRRRHPDRRLGLVFLARDYLHLARYHLERTRGQMTEKARRHLEQAVAIHRQHFASPDDPLHGYSFPLYQSALELLGEGFALEWSLRLAPPRGQDPAPAAGGLGMTERPHRRRFLDEAEAREFLERELTRQLVGEGQEEEFGFEEAERPGLDG
jgi:glycosyltransferase involved in cell wall biosynthesis